MALLAVLDEAAHGALDDSLKTFYVQNSETKEFHLDIAPDEAAKLAHHQRQQLEAKKADLARVHGEKTALAQKLTAFDALGKSADDIKAALEGKMPKEAKELLEKFETDTAALKASYEEPLTKAKTRIERAERQAQELLARTAIQQLRNEFDLNDTADYVLKDFIKVVPKDEESGEFIVKVFENGQPALVAGQEMKPEQLITSFKEQKKFPAMFNAGTGGGSGAPARQTGSGGKAFSVSREASKNNPALYQNAKAEAEKVGGSVTWTD